MKLRIISSVLAAAAQVAQANPAIAQSGASVTSYTTVTFDIEDPSCVLAGRVARLGQFVPGDTGRVYAQRFGAYSPGAATRGSEADVKLVDIACTAGIPWILEINGGQASGGATVRDPNGQPAFDVMAVVHAVDGNAVPSPTANRITWSGNGKVQSVYGSWSLVDVPGAADYVLSKPGTYKASAVATLSW